MAEYKNGVNYRGNMSVGVDDVNSDVQTGRVVFVDEDKYEKDTGYKAKVDKCLDEGFYKAGSEGGGSGGNEPLLITFNAGIDFDQTVVDTVTADVSVSEAMQALSDGRTVLACLKLNNDGEYFAGPGPLCAAYERTTTEGNIIIFRFLVMDEADARLFYVGIAGSSDGWNGVGCSYWTLS